MKVINEGLPFLTNRAENLGLSSNDLRRARLAGELRTMFRGCCVDARVPDTRLLRCMALALVLPDQGVVCFETAAWLKGVDAFEPGRRSLLTPQCMVPHHNTKPRATALLAFEGYLSPDDVQDVGGIPVTSDVRTTADLLRRLHRPFALSAADQMAHAGLVRPVDVRAYLAQLSGFPGIVQARELAYYMEPLTESPGESWQRLRVLDAGFPRPRAQITVRDRRGVIVSRLDDGYDELKIGMFYDGKPFHTDDEARRMDLVKRSILTQDLHWRLVIGSNERIFGEDPGFEWELGGYLGLRPILPRQW